MNNGALWNHDLEALTRSPGLVTSGASLATFRLELARDAKVRECVQRRICNKVNASAAASIAAIRTASFNVFLTPEAQATMTTVARENSNRSFVDKFHG